MNIGFKIDACCAVGGTLISLNTIRWPSGRLVIVDYSYVPHDDPDFGMHLKIRRGKFNADMSIDRDRGVTYEINFDQATRTWTTTKMRRLGQLNEETGDSTDGQWVAVMSGLPRSGMYESLYNCLIMNYLLGLGTI